MTKEDVLQFLKDGLYLIRSGEVLVLSNKFFRDFGVRANDAKTSNSKQPTRVSSPTVSKEDYLKFIEDAEVPTMLSNGQGGKFFANRYSVKGFNAFKAAMSSTDEKVLLAACKWYYKQQNTSKVMIGTWFAEDIYVSCVADIKKYLEKRDKKVVVLGQPTDYGNILPPITEEGSSNMERG